jgi:M6 family metalloprotease-like protein
MNFVNFQKLGLNMKKVFSRVMPLLIFTILLAIVTINVQAAYLKDVPQTVKQPNGEMLNCLATGDEFFNWLHDANGFTIMQNKNTGWYVYADLKNDEFVPTDLIPGKSDPASLGLKPWLIYSEQKLMSFRNKFQIPPAYKQPAKNKDKLQSTENQGVLNNLVIFIRFADETGFSQTASYFDTPYNSKTSVSVYDYFYESSYKQLEIKSTFAPQPNGQTVLSYQDAHPRSYYKVYNAYTAPDGYNNDDERTEREMTLLKNAVEAVTPYIPADMNFDMNGDGYVENVAFVLTGSPEGWADLIWPHMWALFYYDVRINGARVWNFNFLMSSWFDPGVLCHEMGHTLGAPDLYRYYVGGSPVVFWDVMSNQTNPPQYSSSFMKWKYFKWISGIPEITESGWYELNPLLQKYGSSFIIRSKKSASEYYVIEYRKKEGKYESSLPSGGMLVLRINSDYDGNAGGPPDGVYVYRQGGTATSWGNYYNAPFSSDYGRTKINNKSSDPKPFLTDGTLGGLNISNIGTCGQTIKFRVNFPPEIPVLALPVNNDPASMTAPLFKWELTKDADYYSLQLATDKNFTNIIYQKDSIWNTQYQLPFELPYMNTYYWRVKAYSMYEEESDWSQPFIMTISPDTPVIVNQSKSEIICKDGDYFLFVDALGRKVQYQWFKDGIAISGATSEILSKAKAGFDQSAVYYCRLTNLPGKDVVYSNEMAIYVVVNSGFIIQPKTQYAGIGEKVNVTFKVHTNGKEDNYYTAIKWYKNNKLINDDQRFAGSKSDILNIMKLQSDDFNAEYKVEVTGRCGLTIISDKFTINEIPPFKETIVSDTVCAGNEDVFDAVYIGKVPAGYTLQYEWINPFTVVSNDEDSKLKIKYDAYSEISQKLLCNVYLTPGGYLIAKNIYEIVVNDIPVITTDLPESKIVNEGKLLEFNLDWKGINCSTDLYFNEVNYHTVSGMKHLDYFITNVTQSLAGNWKIRVYNDCGEVWTKTCVVTVTPKGSTEPTDVTDLSINNAVHISPNPTNGQLNLTLNNAVDQVNSIDIIDNLGNIVSRIVDINLNGKNININLSSLGLSSGTYSAIIRSNTNVFVGRFVYLK